LEKFLTHAPGQFPVDITSSQAKKGKKMLNIFADALLIAVRMEPRRDDQFARRAAPETEEKAQRRWFALSGMRR
jgi:hypothetical protein